MLATFVVLNLNALRQSAIDQAWLRRSTIGRDPVTVSDFTLARAVPHLPASGRIGYLRRNFRTDNTNDLGGLFRTRYTLAPRIVIAGIGPDVLIAAADADGILPDVPPGYEFAYRYSSALALYRRVR